MSWRKHASFQPTSNPISTLTIEANDFNIVASPIPPNLLLVLVGVKGGSTPSKIFRITPITSQSQAQHDKEAALLEEELVALTARGPSDSALVALTLQRRKAERLAKTIGEESRLLKMPDDSVHG